MESVSKYRIEPNRRHVQQIVRTFGCWRYLYNSIFALRVDAYAKYGLSFSYKDTSGILTAMKRQDHTARLKEVDSTALQCALKRLDRAYEIFCRISSRGGRNIRSAGAGMTAGSRTRQSATISGSARRVKNPPPKPCRL